MNLKCDYSSYNVTCYLESNITCNANSNQSVVIDYGDGSSEVIYIDPYCKINIYYLINYIKFNHNCKDVPLLSSSINLMTNLTSSSVNSKYAFLLNSYIQKNSNITAFEIHCAQKGYFQLRV